MLELPRPGLSPAVFARMTGLSVPRLRSYDARGLLAPAEVDARTGRRRYAAGQLSGARLLAALTATGMPVHEAAAAVATGDRSSVVQHVARTEEALATIAEHVPAPGADRVLTARCAGCSVLEVPLDPRDGVLEQLRRARRGLAVRLGAAPGDLPRWQDAGGLPDGPRVALRRTDDDRWVADRLLLPWPLDRAPADGDAVVVVGHGSWAAVAVGTPEEALDQLDPASDGRSVLQGHLHAPDGGVAIERHLLLDAALAVGALGVRVVRW